MKLGEEARKYIEELKRRKKQSRVTREWQLTGLEMAAYLEDESHKSLYIKLAKEAKNPERLLALARDIGERRRIKRKGAYFMRVWEKETKKEKK